MTNQEAADAIEAEWYEAGPPRHRGKTGTTEGDLFDLLELMTVLDPGLKR